jgi:hypothetical protein
MSTAQQRIEEWAKTGRIPLRHKRAIGVLTDLLAKTNASLALYPKGDPHRKMQEGVMLGIQAAIDALHSDQ